MRTALTLAVVPLFACHPSQRGQLDVVGGALSELHYEVDAPTGRVHLLLERNDELLAPGHRVYALREDGLVEIHNPLPACHYRGRAELTHDDGTMEEGPAALSACDGDMGLVTGFFRVGGSSYRLWHEDGVHRLAPGPGGPADAKTVGVRRLAVPAGMRSALVPAGGDLYLELLVVIDHLGWVRHREAAVQQAQSVVNAAAALYLNNGLPWNVHVNIRALIVAEAGNPFAVNEAGDYLNENAAFVAWRRTLPSSLRADMGVLLRYASWANPDVLGASPVGAICTEDRGGLTVRPVEPSGFAGHVLAHELGHAYNMLHDSAGGYVMSPSADPSSYGSVWSAASKGAMEAWLTNVYTAPTADPCLDASPTDVWGTRCGDGTIDGDEQCDCGLADCSQLDPCCDGATCKLVAGAECTMMHGCCDSSCHVKPASTVCEPESACVPAAQCDGVSQFCPVEFLPAGSACITPGGWAGACYRDKCLSYEETCAAQAGPQFAARCTSASGFCTQLRCAQPSSPNFCGPTPVYDPEDGMPCGSGLICMGASCVSAAGLTYDYCPTDPDKTRPGICGCGTAETNADSDAQPDCRDACPLNAEKIAPGACGCDVPDVDSDSDGTADCIDACPDDGVKVGPGVCGCGILDDDTDDDGTADCDDGCPQSGIKTAPGECGCDVADTDGDDDGTPDCQDRCPADDRKTQPGLCGCAVDDVDSDADEVPDCTDACPLAPWTSTLPCSLDAGVMADAAPREDASAGSPDASAGPDDASIASQDASVADAAVSLDAGPADAASSPPDARVNDAAPALDAAVSDISRPLDAAMPLDVGQPVMDATAPPADAPAPSEAPRGCACAAPDHAPAGFTLSFAALGWIARRRARKARLMTRTPP